MSFTRWLQKLQSFCRLGTSTRKGRRAARPRPAKRVGLHLEALEDRCLPSFLAPVSYAVGSFPQSVVSADFNNDAVLDLAIGNSSSNSVSVLLGNANGTFQPAQNSATGTSPALLATGDFNADGKLDLVTRNNPSSLSVLLGNGNGTFQSPLNVANVYAMDVAAGDINGDGKLDLAVVKDASIDVLPGNGNGTFGAPMTKLLANSYLTSGVLQDFNADGNLDLATTDYVHGVRVLAGNGDGTFAAPVDYAAGALSVVVGDVNDDGISDLITRGNYGLSMLLGNGAAGVGDGTFQPAQYTALSLNSLAVGDFNADGKLDLVGTSNESIEFPESFPPRIWTGYVHVLLGHGDGTFAAFRTTTFGDSRLSASANGDFNGDGLSDVAVTSVDSNNYSDNVSVLLNDGVWPDVNIPELQISDATVTEGNTGTTAATFTVSLWPAYGQTVSVHYETADSTNWDSATAGVDYQPVSGTLTFAPGVTSQTISVPIIGDRLLEDNESFVVRLTDLTNASFRDASGFGVIRDDDPSIYFDDYLEGKEGNTGTTPFNFTVFLSAAYDIPVTVDYATTDLTSDEQIERIMPGATAGVDYIAASGTLTIPAGKTSGTITILVNGDRLSESDEYFWVNLTGSNGVPLTNSQAIGAIMNDEPYVRIGGGGAVTEGNSGTKNVTVTVYLSDASDAPVTVTYATADGSATAGSDYQALSNTLTFAPGETSKTITVLVNGDRIGESNETFFVTLSNASNASIANGTGQVTILDDEPRISISDVTRKEGNGKKTTLFVFTVTLSAAYDQPVTMSFRTVNGTATTSDNDYIARTGTLTFAPGETTKTITIEVKGDSKKEANETFTLELFGASNNALFTRNRGLGTILNDD